MSFGVLSGLLPTQGMTAVAAPQLLAEPPAIVEQPVVIRRTDPIDDREPPNVRLRQQKRPAVSVVRVEPNGRPAPLNSVLRITFSQPMARDTVESAFRIEPRVAGSLTWLDDQALQFQPVGLAYGTTYRVEVDGFAKVGEPLGGAHTWSFATERLPPLPASRFTLTFDDCAPAWKIQAILGALAERGLRAIFFPTGVCRDTNPWLVPTLLRRGHTVCNHTYSHPVLTKLSDAAIFAEIRNGVSTGCDLFRPPYGASDARVAAIASSLGYRMFLWDVDTRDWAGTSAEAMVAAVRARGGIVLMHLHGLHSVEAIGSI